MKSWLAYAQLVRLPNVFTAIADILLAAAATTLFREGGQPVQLLDYLGTFALLMLASACLYSGGMVWNDYFDLEQDLRERPFRPIASGRVSLQAAVVLGSALVLLGLAAA